MDVEKKVIKEEIDIHDDFDGNVDVKQEFSDKVSSATIQNVNNLHPIKQEINVDLKTVQEFEESMIAVKIERDNSHKVDIHTIRNKFKYLEEKPGSRIKSIAYSEKEKLLLASLVDIHNLVKNKKTDTATLQKKQEEWETICREYNAQVSVISSKRNAAQLKKLWSNLKQRKRKATTELHYNRLLTGGVPLPEENHDADMEAVDVAALQADVSMSCPWDSTAVLENSSEQSSQSEGAPIIDEDANRDIFLPSTSDKKTKTSIQTEATLSLQKMWEAIRQQQELHEIQMAIEREQLHVARANRCKAEAEQELAELQLKLFKTKK